MNIADRIRLARERKGGSQMRLAEVVGVSQPTVAAWESPDAHKMRRDNRDKLAAALDVDAEWIEYGTGRGPADAAPAADRIAIPPRPPEPVITARPVELPPLHTMPRNVPVYGVAAGNGDTGGGDFQLETGAVIDYAPRPPGITSTRDAYALYVTGDSMEPRFEHGELVYISPSKPVRPSDYVILCLRGAAPGEPERCFIKRLVRRHPDRVEVRQFNPDKVLTFPTATIARMHRVLTVADLFGAM